MTYGDGVCDVDIGRLLAYHRSTGKIATLTAVKTEQRFGVLEIENGSVRAFREKSKADGEPINAGYMVLEPEIFSYLDGDDTVFEREPLEKLARKNQLSSFMHTGFWQCMDTKKEHDLLEQLWQTGEAPWKVWR